MQSPTALRALLQPIVTMAALIAIAVTRADPDLWGHVRYGLDMLEARAIPTVDPYSFTSDRLWINHEWLAEIAFALAYRTAGAYGLIVLKLVIVSTAIALMLSVARREGARGHALLIIGVLTVAAVLPRAQQIRPQLFSILWFAALIAILHAADRGRRRALLVAPLVMIAWANTHGGWLVGCATIGAWTVGHLWQHRTSAPRTWCLPLAACGTSVLATLINPYGMGLWQFLYETVGPTRRFIAEWGPITGVPTVLIPWLLSCTLGVLLLRRGGIPANPAHAFIPVAWAIASARVSRLDAFFAMSVIGFLSGPLVAWLGERESRRTPTALDTVAPPTWRFRVPALAAAIAVTVPFWSAITCIDVHRTVMPEVGVMQFIQSTGLRGRMVTYFDWGQYAIWHLPPGLRISMDGRRETVYQASTIDQHLDLYLGTATGLAYLGELNPDYVWLPRRSPALAHLVQHGWRRLFEGEASMILAREAPLRTAPLGMQSGESQLIAECRCFPGP